MDEFPQPVRDSGKTLAERLGVQQPSRACTCSHDDLLARIRSLQGKADAYDDAVHAWMQVSGGGPLSTTIGYLIRAGILKLADPLPTTLEISEHWPKDPTPKHEVTDLRMCDDKGMVSNRPVEPGSPGTDETPGLTYLGLLNRLRNTTGLPPAYESFQCTGSAHLAGTTFHCTSPAHGGPA
jgi:hypothetical protein